MDRENALAITPLSTTPRSASTSDQRSDEELFLATLQGGYEDDAPNSERPHLRQSVDLAIEHLSESDGLVANSAAWALSHLGDDRAVSALIRVRGHNEPSVRWAVACGMAGGEQPGSIETLMLLMEDTDDDVRNWATFGLGGQCVADSPDIRLALKERLDDPFEDARDEALWGLARRKDREALVALLSRLRSEKWLTGDEIAAAEVLDVDYDAPVGEMCSGIERMLVTI